MRATYPGAGGSSSRGGGSAAVAAAFGYAARPMNFLDRFTPDQRASFEAAAVDVQVPRGQYLLRRGEPGGDVYLVRSGSFEIVDTRNTPEVIVAVLDEGAVVGEMAFLDDSPRSADVRAAQDGHVLRWARDDLRALLRREPAVAASFYESVARLAGDRIRATTTAATSGTRVPRQDARAGISRAREDAQRIAESVKEAFLDIDTRLRQDPTDADAQARLTSTLDRLQDEMNQLFTANTDPELAKAAARVLGRELHPYLVRSALAERCIRHPEGVGGAADILAHVLVGSAGGDGQFGELVDRWLLERPMLAAIRAFREPVIELVSSRLPTFRNRRVLVVNAGTGSLVASLSHAVSRAPTVVTVLDQSKEALAYLDAGLSRPRSVDFGTIQEGLVAVATGRAKLKLPPQDAIVLQGLVEYMPERIAISLLAVCVPLLAPEGFVVVCGLGPSPDVELFDHLLNWPTIRRSREGMRRIFAGAGLDAAEHEMHAPALVFSGSVAAPVAQRPLAAATGAS
jgi:extracellular factor (EF) 3-hydroxypalmitic acid methyl ester biosynthesis protein